MLDTHAPKKTEVLRANNKPYVTKAMRKAIMKRSDLATTYRAQQTEENQNAFKNQRNFCNRLNKKERRKYYKNLDLRKINDRRKFWDTIKPFLSDKSISSQKTSLKEGKTDDIEVTNVLNKHFINSVRCLAEKGGCNAHILEINSKEDPLDNIIARFKHSPSMILIGQNRSDEIFDFALFTTDVVSSDIKK